MALPKIEEQAFLNESIYDIKSKTGDIDIEKFAENKDKDKDPIQTPHDYIQPGTATVDVSATEIPRMDVTSNQEKQFKELFGVDSIAEIPGYESGPITGTGYLGASYQASQLANKADNSAKYFNNINSDNYFYRDVGAKGLEGALTLADIYAKPGGGGPTGSFVTGMMSAVMGGGFPLATAASWVAYGFAQERDQNNFVRKLKGGLGNLLDVEDIAGEQTYKYEGKSDMTTKQYMNHILFNSNNPGYRLKKYAEYGTTPQNALATFMNDGVEKGVFNQEDIRKMGSSRHDLQPGSDAYMKAWAAEKALKDKGYEVRGRVAIAPDGTQYLDGVVWEGKGKKDLSKAFKDDDKPKVTTKDTTQEDAQKEREKQQQQQKERQEAIAGGAAGASAPSQQQGKQSSGSDQPVSRDTTSGKPTTGFGSWFSSAEGGRVSFQAGGPLGNPMGQQQEQQQPIQDAGNLELVQEQGKDQSGVADDVKRKLNEGDFVINAPAMEMAGRGDIERMITKAITELQRKGIKLDFGQAAEDTDSIVQALVSNKEMVIPKVIAEQIGYDRLEKINNRGKQRVDEIEKERQQQQQQGFIQGNPQAQTAQPVQTGGQITLEENKNQPIAIPKEGFAGMSSVGKRLLSPLSPEQQDREKELLELSKPSQSFEGFLKPIGMNKGDVVSNTADYDVDIISRMIMTEAFDSPEEWAAMAHVVLNREKDFGNYMPSSKGNTNIEKLILGENQFKGIVDNPEIFNNPQDTTLGKEKYKKVYQVVQNVLDGKIKDNTDGATYFDLQQKGAGQRIGKHWYHYGKGTKYNPIIPTIKPKPQQMGMMAVN